MMFGQALPCHLGEKSLKLMRPNSGSRLVKSEKMGFGKFFVLFSVGLMCVEGFMVFQAVAGECS